MANENGHGHGQLAVKVLRTSKAFHRHPHDVSPWLCPRTPRDRLSLSSLVCLPQSFGTIYLGESFSGLVSVRFEDPEEEEDERSAGAWSGAGGAAQEEQGLAGGGKVLSDVSLAVEIYFTASPAQRPMASSGASKDTVHKVLLGQAHRPLLRQRKGRRRGARKAVAEGLDDACQPLGSGPAGDQADGAEDDDGLELLVNYDLVELGLHSLVCTVTYTDQTMPSSSALVSPSEPLKQNPSCSFRKHYKFQVLNPLSVKTKIRLSPKPNELHPSHALSPSQPGLAISTASETLPMSPPMTMSKVYYLEVQIQNQTLDSLTLERVHFLPLINNHSTLSTSSSLLGPQEEVDWCGLSRTHQLVSLAPKAAFQFLFIIRSHEHAHPAQSFRPDRGSLIATAQESSHHRKTGSSGVLAPFPTTTTPMISTVPSEPSNRLGRLDIQWRRRSGEAGKLCTSYLSLKPSASTSTSSTSTFASSSPSAF